MKKTKNNNKKYTQPTTLNQDNKKELNYALDRFVNLLQLGYTSENFSNLSRCVNVIKKHVSLSDAKHVESFWRDAYTDLYEEDKLDSLMTRLRTSY